MEVSPNSRVWLGLMVRTFAVLTALLAACVAGILLFSGHLRGPIVRYVAAQSGRDIRIDGTFSADLLSWHPRIVAERVTIGNPPWTAPGVTAQIGRLVLTYNVPWFGQSFGIHTLEARQATFTLSRDEAGDANWQTQEPGTGRSTGPPIMQKLSLPNAQVHLDDRIRHLKFDGSLSAQDATGQGPNPPLRAEGAGMLNGRQVNFTLNGEPLATVTAGKPYRFEFTESSSGSRLTGRGSVPHPFDFQELETAFEAAGEDMKDLFFLTGVTLPDTGRYHSSGKFARHGRRLDFTDLEASSGRSDVRASLSIELRRDAPSHVEVNLQSNLLRTVDLGLKAAGRAPKSAEDAQLVLPDTEYQLTGLRKIDAVVNFHAQTLEMGPAALQSATARITINGAMVSATPMSALWREGKLHGDLKIDISRDMPAVDMDLRFAGVQLLDGPMQARISLKGHGRSIHGVASKAEGTVTAVLPRGAIRASVAEMAGFDFRALGLMASGNTAETGIRCGVASFDVKDGTLTAQRLLLDTDPVLMTGEGSINLASEAMDLQLRGHPKHPRLRLRGPLLVRGTLGHPSFSIGAGKSAAQAGSAIALGVLLTPVAAMLAFVDPGLAKDTDCAALLAQVRR